MKSFSRIPVILFTGILFLMMAPKLSAQNSQSQAEREKPTDSAFFSEVFDSKIAREDSGLIIQLIEKSGHAEFLKNASGSEIYILDLDHFRNGLPPCEALGKSIRVITKAELKSMNPPFYVTVDNYINRENSCSAGITVHKTSEPTLAGDAKAVTLSKKPVDNRY